MASHAPSAKAPTKDGILSNPFAAGTARRTSVFGSVEAANISEMNEKLLALYRPRDFTAKEVETMEKMLKFLNKVNRNAEPAAPKAPKPTAAKPVKAAVEYTYTSPAPGQKKDTSGPMPPSYNPREVEDSWHAWWEANGFFRPEYIQNHANIPCEDPEKTFTIVIPPPNVTGSLHIGHALSTALEDSLTRWHRMTGKAALFNPGCDHAGIATQSVVEKKLKRESNLTKFDLGREKFIERVWEWKEQYGSRIYTQLKALGGSMDWSREQFTMNPRCSKAVQEAFVQLHERGLIFRSRRMINWSCRLQSAISEIEVEKRELSARTLINVPGYDEKVTVGVITSFAYKVHGSQTIEEIVVATTRIETMLGDVAVAVHPQDARFKHLHGKHLIHPFSNRLMIVVADEMVDMNFGSGAVKITPAHDPNDYECGLRHKLPEHVVIDFDGKMINCGEFSGLPRFTARARVLQRLKDMGLYRSEADNPMVVPICSRSGDIIEPLLAPQWFVDCKSMAAKAVTAVESGELQLIPKSFDSVWFSWMKDIRDWCISRQLWWGHRIPAYFVAIDGQPPKSGSDNDSWVVGRTEEEALAKAAKKFGVDASKIKLTQDEDVLDTWFSSGIFPISIFGWPEQTADLLQFYPTQVLETGHDILFFWVARMVMMCTELTGQLPFKHVYLHPIVRDAHGRKMSKSLGNVIDPMDVRDGISLANLKERLKSSNLDPKEFGKACEGLDEDFPTGIPECGVDALRFALCAFVGAGRDINLDVSRIFGYRTFCNKIFNAVKYLRMQVGDFTFVPNASAEPSGNESKIDLWILSRLSNTVAAVEKGLKAFDFSAVTTEIYGFWMHDFCDVYLELSKPVLYGSDESRKRAAQDTLYTCIDFGLRLISPFMPYLSEELFQRIPRRQGDGTLSVCVAAYPRSYKHDNAQLEQDVAFVQSIIKATRSLSTKFALDKASPKIFLRTKNENNLRILKAFTSDIQALAKAGSVQLLEGAEVPAGCSLAVELETEIYLLVAGLIDVSKEIATLSQKRAELHKNLAKLEAKISSEGYANAPDRVKQQEAEKLGQYKAEIESINTAIANFEQLK
eukprot:m.434676 g.434676  ORF g.434676 m.434676 type:complete len:1081 (-) comp56759_c0_seq4:1545-4787(-)